MKTKNKMIAFLEIAIVLGLLFFVAMPAIAAEEDDFVLDIYGNANEDDTIDMRDLTYVKLIFFGKKPETELADAKYDGKINPLDFIQIKLIIVGKEKELTFIDSDDRIVTVNKPIERIVLCCGSDAETVRILDAMDRVVGHSTCTDKKTAETLFPELVDLPMISMCPTADYEALLSLDPDLYMTMPPIMEDAVEKLPGVPIAGFYLYKGEILLREMRTLSYILDSEEQAQEYVDFFEGYVNAIKERTETIPEDEKPKVYNGRVSPYKTFNENGGIAYQIEIAGGRNIAEGLPGCPWGSVEVDPEWVVEQNPQFMFTWYYGKIVGYDKDDPSEAEAEITRIFSLPELALVDAVKNENVYIIDYEFFYNPSKPAAIVYLAKAFYPELFEDLDAQAVHQEYMDRFHEILDWNVYEHGIFVYPPLKE